MNAVSDLAWLAAPVAALLASCLVLVPLGAQVLSRGVVFIDLAVAQVAACGVLAAGMLVENAQAPVVTAAAAASAMLGGLLVWWLARRWPAQREALIGLVYIAGASAAVLAVAADPHGRERLAALLAADVLWVPWGTVLLLVAAAAGVTALRVARPHLLGRDGAFYALFALALSLVVQALGLYLVFALLIGPALWTRRGVGINGSIAAAVAACTAGLALSWGLDWPSGATIALSLSGLGFLSAFRR